MSYHESWLFQHSFRRFKAHERVIELGSTSVEVLNVLLELLVAAHDYFLYFVSLHCLEAISHSDVLRLRRLSC